MSVETLHRPTHRDALVALEGAFERGDLVVVFGRCSVEYDGRASSSLGPGDRLVLLKPDGSALVHTDEKRTPVNWQPPGSEHRASVRDGRLRVQSRRSTPEEVLDVRFERVDQLSAFSVAERADLSLVGSEEDLRERVLAEPSLVEAGFEPLDTERETTAGPVDVFGCDAEGHPVVVELKRRRVGPSAVRQLQGYVDAVSREDDAVGVRGVLVAPSVTDRAAALLDERGFGFVALEPDEGEDDEASEDGDGR
ncbi:endonuclease NucS [Salinigranum salinum]|uniref:endonuclease NucS n=1 Tax=Salinigranum salinum TaxID=1364937 RepID=UPI0012612C4C|nr:endonuclease NucS [Salinigranum salinum]